MSGTTPFATWKARVADLPRAGREVVLEASRDERAALAAQLDLVAMHALAVRLRLRPWSAGGVKVTGELAARVEQRCVVTLQPVPADLDVSFVRTFLPQTARAPRGGQNGEIDIELETDDPPEPLDGTHIDLAAIVVEELVLNLDPYPRHRDAPAQPLPDELEHGGEERPAGPFSVLKNLGKSNRD